MCRSGGKDGFLQTGGYTVCDSLLEIESVAEIDAHVLRIHAHALTDVSPLLVLAVGAEHVSDGVGRHSSPHVRPPVVDDDGCPVWS